MNHANTIEMVRGTTNSIVVNATMEDGTPLELVDGAKLIFGVKSSVNNSTCCIKKTLTEGAGEFEFRLCPEDTAELRCARMCYDVGLQIGEDYFCVIPCSPFVLTHNVTSKEG